MGAAEIGAGKRGGEEMKALLPCPFCGHDSPVLKVSTPDYGKSGAEVICPLCGGRTGLFPVHEHYVERGVLHTPITAESIAKGREAATRGWNARA